MKESIKLISLFLITALIWSVLSLGITVWAEETPSVSVTFDRTEFCVGETYTPTIIKSSPNLNLVWSVTGSSASKITVTQSGQITALAVGRAMIKIRCANPNNPSQNIFSQDVIVTVYDSLGIESGLSYYIMNVESQRLLSSASSNASSYANVVTSTRNWQAKTQWQVLEQADSSVKLKSFGGASGTILKAIGTNIEVETDEYGSAEKFYVMRVDDGDKKGLYLITNGDYCLTQDSATSNYNVYLTDEPNDFSYWSFMKVEKGDAEFFGFDYSGFSTSDDSLKYYNMALAYGYGIDSCINSDIESFADELRLEDLMLYSGHGNVGMLTFTDEYGIYAAVIANNNVSVHDQSIPTWAISDCEYNELSSMRCVMYMGCLTGCGASNSNLVDVTYSKGAHFVFGITVEINAHYCTAWTNNFYQRLLEGYNIIDSIIGADADTSTYSFVTEVDLGGNYIYGTLDAMPSVYVGDAYQYISIY